MSIVRLQGQKGYIYTEARMQSVQSLLVGLFCLCMQTFYLLCFFVEW